MYRSILTALFSLSIALSQPTFAQPTQNTDQDVSDAWIYLYTRLLVLRQEQLDFHEGFKWNELVHRTPGAVDWPNPNLDVAYSEAWVATDENSCTIVTVPKIAGRYYTVQFLNGWDETLANINERVFPNKPDGDFAICLRGKLMLQLHRFVPVVAKLYPEQNARIFNGQIDALNVSWKWHA